MATLKKISVLYILLGYLALTPSLSLAQERPSIDEMLEKFARNFALLQQSVNDTYVNDSITAIIGQSNDLAQSYRANGKTAQEKLIDLQEELKLKDKISKSDQKRIQNLTEDLRSQDPDREFSSGRNLVQASLDNLRRRIKNISSTDSFEQAILELLERHIDLYKAMLQRTQSFTTGGGKNRGDQMDTIEEILKEMTER